MNTLRPFSPVSKSRWLLSQHGTPKAGRHAAVQALRQHTPGTHSHTYWSDVLRSLGRNTGGKPHTRSEKRKLRIKK